MYIFKNLIVVLQNENCPVKLSFKHSPELVFPEKSEKNNLLF